MAEKFQFEKLKEYAKEKMDSIDIDAIKENADKTGGALKEIAGKAGVAIKGEAIELKDKAIQTKDDINEKLTELDRMLESTINEYNDSYTLMNDKAVQLFVERNRSTDSIDNVKNLVNSISNHPKEFDAEFEVIDNSRKKFRDSCDFAQGLEYSSVKIVITDEVDELITHNIFYTAITRARNLLKIYWTPEVEHKVLTTIKPRDIKKDVGILRKYL